MRASEIQIYPAPGAASAITAAATAPALRRSPERAAAAQPHEKLPHFGAPCGPGVFRSISAPLRQAEPGGGRRCSACARLLEKRPRRRGATEQHGGREERAAHTSGFAPPRPRPRPAPRRMCCRRGRRLRLLLSSPPDRTRPAAARGGRPRTPSRTHTPPCHVTCRRAAAAAGPNRGCRRRRSRHRRGTFSTHGPEPRRLGMRGGRILAPLQLGERPPRAKLASRPSLRGPARRCSTRPSRGPSRQAPLPSRMRPCGPVADTDRRAAAGGGQTRILWPRTSCPRQHAPRQARGPSKSPPASRPLQAR